MVDVTIRMIIILTIEIVLVEVTVVAMTIKVVETEKEQMIMAKVMLEMIVISKLLLRPTI